MTWRRKLSGILLSIALSYTGIVAIYGELPDWRCVLVLCLVCPAVWLVVDKTLP
jgi:hypothetical protein